MPVRIVAELSANHLGDIGRAYSLISHAKAAGADAVKFQAYTPEQMAEPGVLITSGPWAGREALELYREAHMPRAWFPELFECARELEIEAFSSVFHPDDVDFLETLGCPRYKIASFELTDHALISHAAATGKPLIISTGMAIYDEIAEAAFAAWHGGCRDLTLLKCTSAYPAPAHEINLAAMQHFGILPGTRYGLSDHTLGIGVAVAAAALGASMIEKHLTLARADGGPDAAFSMEPGEFTQMVVECRRASQALGEVRYGPSEAEAAHLGLRRASGGKRGL
jgi:sialic acid synthase SpsE